MEQVDSSLPSSGSSDSPSVAGGRSSTALFDSRSLYYPRFHHRGSSTSPPHSLVSVFDNFVLLLAKIPHHAFGYAIIRGPTSVGFLRQQKCFCAIAGIGVLDRDVPTTTMFCAIVVGVSWALLNLEKIIPLHIA